jgi:uncharacterized membrane protein
MIEKIKELFAMLPRADQLELLRELNSNVTAENPVTSINELSQMLYGQNIKFDVTNVGDQLHPNIKVELTTPWGVFEAHGNNQRIARVKAAEVALVAHNNASSETTPDNNLNLY